MDFLDQGRLSRFIYRKIEFCRIVSLITLKSMRLFVVFGCIKSRRKPAFFILNILFTLPSIFNKILVSFNFSWRTYEVTFLNTIYIVFCLL